MKDSRDMPAGVRRTIATCEQCGANAQIDTQLDDDHNSMEIAAAWQPAKISSDPVEIKKGVRALSDRVRVSGCASFRKHDLRILNVDFKKMLLMMRHLRKVHTGLSTIEFLITSPILMTCELVAIPRERSRISSSSPFLNSPRNLISIPSLSPSNAST